MDIFASSMSLHTLLQGISYWNPPHSLASCLPPPSKDLCSLTSRSFHPLPLLFPVEGSSQSTEQGCPQMKPKISNSTKASNTHFIIMQKSLVALVSILHHIISHHLDFHSASSINISSTQNIGFLLENKSSAPLECRSGSKCLVLSQQFFLSATII